MWNSTLKYSFFFFRFKDYKSILPLLIDTSCSSFSSSCTKDICPFHKVQTASGTHPASQPSGTADFILWGYIGCGVWLTSCFYLAPKLKIRGAITPRPPPISLYKEGSTRRFYLCYLRSSACANIDVQ